MEKLLSVEEVKAERDDLKELWSGMTKEQLYEELWKEATDAINMETRVQVFMLECTDMSKTTYTPEVIKGLVQDKERHEISNFCKSALEDIEGMDIEEIKAYLKEEVIEI